VRHQISHTSEIIGTQIAVRWSVLYADRDLPPRKILGNNLCYKLSQPPGHSVAEKNKTDSVALSPRANYTD
jgi:hypothetical protein